MSGDPDVDVVVPPQTRAPLALNGARKPPGVRRIACFVFFLALVIRLAWCTLATVTPISDCAGYHKLACTLLATGQLHHGLGEAWRTPAYPGFLAGVYALFGENVRAAALVQSLLGALSAAAVVWLASLVASPRTSLLAGVLQAVWPTAVVYTPVLVSENLASPLLLLSLVCIAWGGRGNRARAAAPLACAGVLFGLLLLVRPANCFFAPAILLLLLYDFARRRWRLILPLVFVACALLTVSPWLIRNDRLGLEPFTLSTQGGLALWWGNNPETDDGTAEPPRFAEAEQLGEVARDRFYREKALAWIRDHPRRYLALCGVRAVRFLGKQPDWFAAKFAWPTPDNDLAIRQRYEAATYGKDVPKERIDYAQALENRHMRYELRLRRAVAPLMLLALVWSLFRWRQWAPVNLPALSYSIGLALTVFLERFRMVSDPLFLIVFAALLADVVVGTRDLGGGRVARVAKAALAILLVTASIYAHKARLDRNWYELAPSRPRQTAPSATRLADPVSLCAGTLRRAPASGPPPLYDLSTWN